MSRLSAFFNESGTEGGAFYPNQYLLALFANLTDAKHATQELNKAGSLSGDMITASGEELVEYAADRMAEGGVWGVFMRHLSRSIGTESAYTDQDIAAAEAGAALVAIHCPTEDSKSAAWRVLEPIHPLAARYYSGGGIEHLTGEV